MKKTIIWVIACLMVSGCAVSEKYAGMSSTVIDCKADQIEIENAPLIGFLGTQSWEAICKGKRYICSHDPQTGVSCTEMINPFAP